MNVDQSVYTADEFERESRYLEKTVWEALVIEPDTDVLFCGFGPDGEHVARAIATGARVTVIEHRVAAIARFSHLGARVLRGSTSVIPATEDIFDLAVAFHYLHEIDPLFHAQVLSELARVARRIAIVEPAPPADALGMRIVRLYAQAKRELGQFEYYQSLDYWKRLLRGVKAEVSQHVFAFSKVPPKDYLADTIDLLLHTIAVEEAPQSYIDELRTIARESDAQLLPPPRYVLVGAAVGEVPVPKFTVREPISAPPTLTAMPPIAAASQSPAPASSPGHVAAQAQQPRVSVDAGYEFPSLENPLADGGEPAPQSPWPKLEKLQAKRTGPASGGTQTPDAPFGAPFSAWQWEPPDDDTEEPFGAGGGTER
jgi:hypothetical protein